MLPVLALVGRPNVGKSTLFNRLTRSRDAIVNDQPGVTRDRLHGRGRVGDKGFLAVDTGGLEAGGGRLGAIIRSQVELAIEEAQAILFMVDAGDGLVAQDRDIGAQLRQSGVPVFVLVNKSEGVEPELAAAEFQELGLGAPFAISAKRGDGVEELIAAVLAEHADEPAPADDGVPRIALAGRPNVGKSTLANKLARESRVLVSDAPGTTRDSVRMPLCIDGERIVLIDTAGVRKKARVAETIEKFSVIKTLQAMEEANVVVLMLDATCEIGAQDATIAGMIQDIGRSMVLAVNKWDRLADRQRRKIKDELDLKLPFLPDPEIIWLSALHGSGLAEVVPAALRAYRGAMISIATASVNQTLAQAIAQTPPPLHRRRPVRLKFAHQAGKNPPVIVVHGGQAERMPASYRRYLSRYFARAYNLRGTPVRIIPRSGDNPYIAKPSRGTRKRKPSAPRKKRSARAGKS
ncbi:MAG: ribosome biogenesis GTPase Der [bacterium]